MTQKKWITWGLTINIYFVKYIKLFETRRTTIKAYVIHYSDGVAQVEYANNESSAISKAISLTQKPNIKEINIFRNLDTSYSTADDKYLIKWWGIGHYWYNKSVEYPELLYKYLFGLKGVIDDILPKLNYLQLSLIKKKQPKLWSDMVIIKPEINNSATMGDMGFND